MNCEECGEAIPRDSYYPYLCEECGSCEDCGESPMDCYCGENVTCPNCDDTWAYMNECCDLCPGCCICELL